MIFVNIWLLEGLSKSPTIICLQILDIASTVRKCPDKPLAFFVIHSTGICRKEFQRRVEYIYVFLKTYYKALNGIISSFIKLL